MNLLSDGATMSHCSLQHSDGRTNGVNYGSCCACADDLDVDDCRERTECVLATASLRLSLISVPPQPRPQSSRSEILSRLH